MQNKNGYSNSIMVKDPRCCALCGRMGTSFHKLDRHEPWGGANRQKSKRLGLWLPLCHEGCHLGPGSVHSDAALARDLRVWAQTAAMGEFGWSVQDWRAVFGKSELSESEARAEAEDCERSEDSAGVCDFRIVHEAPMPF